MFVKLSPYIIAMSIGLIIGIEREQRVVNAQQPMGVRSFILFSLLGAISGSIGVAQPIVALGLVAFASAATLFGYLRATRILNQNIQPIGLTSEIAAMATFALGYFCNKEPILSLSLGVIMFLVLSNKTTLHRWTKEKLKANELQAAAVLLLLAIGVIPILPDRTIDPFHIFNPRRLGAIISLVAAIQFLGYAAARIFGNNVGTALSGFLAGNISSTAAFASYPRLAKERPSSAQALAGAATFAVVATLCQLFVILAAISWPLALALAWPLTLLITLCVGTGIFLVRKNRRFIDKEHLGNPLNLMSAIKLGSLLTALIFIVELSERFAGEALTKLVTFLGALFELQGVVIAAANMFENHTITLEMAANTLMLAVIASFVSKLGLTAILAQGVYRKYILTLCASLIILSLLIWLLMIFVPSLNFFLI